MTCPTGKISWALSKESLMAGKVNRKQAFKEISGIINRLKKVDTKLVELGEFEHMFS